MSAFNFNILVDEKRKLDFEDLYAEVEIESKSTTTRNWFRFCFHGKLNQVVVYSRFEGIETCKTISYERGVKNITNLVKIVNFKYTRIDYI